MKYLSIEDCKTWEPWDRIQADTKRYKDYVQTIRHLLPPDLQRLCDFSPGWGEHRISLNDSQLSSISASFAAQTVMLVLDGEYTDENDRQIGLRRSTLNYIGVADFRINAGSENAYNPGPDWEAQTEVSAGISSLGIDFDNHLIDEIELMAEGLLEHRMLFSSGTEVAVRFRDFRIGTVDTPHETK